MIIKKFRYPIEIKLVEIVYYILAKSVELYLLGFVILAYSNSLDRIFWRVLITRNSLSSKFMALKSLIGFIIN